MVFGIAAGIWKPRHIECSDNREAAFAKRVSDWSLGSCPHKNSWRFLPEFRGRSCDARLFCNRRLIICCLLKQWFQKGRWWFRNDSKSKCEGAVTRDSEAFWSKSGKETRKTGWSLDSIEKNNPLSRSLRAVVRGASGVNACMGQGRYIRWKSLRSILPKEKLGSSSGRIREENRGQ